MATGTFSTIVTIDIGYGYMNTATAPLTINRLI